MNKYIPTIGLEVHAELKTSSKMFCACKNDPDEERPNVNVCPVCMGHPGTLPVLNKQAIKHVLKVGLAVNGAIADFTEWDRKNYFYPDIPKGYQISQYKYPLVSGGELAGVALERIHLEEDTAQSTHDTHENSLVNFNRAGVPLMELVTKPVIHDAETAVAFAKELQLLLRTLDAGEANLEKGEMRIEANISVASEADTDAGRFGTKTEVKNLNSFRSVGDAIKYEVARQSKALDAGEKISQETRGWDADKNETYSQRSKESSHDYRYFPDPDIPKLKVSEMKELDLDALRKELPELAASKRDRYKNIFGMTDKEAAILIDSPSLAKYYESVVAAFADDKKKVKLTTNYLLNSPDALRHTTIDTKNFSELIGMIAAGEVSSTNAKDLLGMMIADTKASPKSLADRHGLIQKSDASALAPAIEKVIADHQKAVTEYKAGKTASLQFLIGMSMRATKGANPEVVKKMLIEKLGS